MLSGWSLGAWLVDAGSDAGEGVDAAVAEPVAGAFQGEDVGVVNDAVDHRGGDCLVAEHATPARERKVRGEDQRGVFIARRDELEDEVRSVLLEGQVADFVDDDQSGNKPRSRIVT